MSLEDLKTKFDEKLAKMTDEEIFAEFEEIQIRYPRKPMKFYRVCNPKSNQGLWYDFKGNFTGLIHNRFRFCKNSDLKMDFDPELVGWLSAVEELDDLYQWFTVEDIKLLQDHEWYIHEYEVDNYRFYDRFQHPVICQETSRLTKRIILL